MASIDLSIGFVFLCFAVFTLVAPAIFFWTSRESSRRRRAAYGALSADFLDSMDLNFWIDFFPTSLRNTLLLLLLTPVPRIVQRKP